MGWFRVDDHYFEHWKILEAGEDAANLNLRALAYCSRNQTDGFIHKDQISLLTRKKNTNRLVTYLVDAGLWIEKGNGYVIHDYLDHQSSRAEIRQRKAGSAERMRQSRTRRSQAVAPQHLECDSEVQAPDTEPPTDTEPEGSIPDFKHLSLVDNSTAVVAREAEVREALREAGFGVA